MSAAAGSVTTGGGMSSAGHYREASALVAYLVALEDVARHPGTLAAEHVTAGRLGAECARVRCLIERHQNAARYFAGRLSCL